VRDAAIPAGAIPGVSIPSMSPPRLRVPSWAPAAIAIAVFLTVAGALLGIGRPPAEQRVAGITHAPTSTTGPSAVIIAPGGSIAGPSAEPGPTEPPGGPRRTARPGAGATEPPEPTEPPKTPKPTRPPTPPPTPPPPPTATPGASCTVPNLIDTPAKKAEGLWADAGFTGSVSLWPVPPPNYTIGWQSLLAETLAPCTSDLLVQRDPP
jgi:hypothetical protein